MADEERLATKSKSSEDDNKISELLNSAKALQNTKLDLSRKSLHDIPHQTYDLSRLEFLYLEGNCLTEIPEEFFEYLNHLKWLDLRNNKITFLPRTIGLARAMRSLLLEGNKIKELPLELGLVKTLTGLHLAGNPLDFPPSHIVEQGTQVIVHYLREHLLALRRDSREEEEGSFEEERPLARDEDRLFEDAERALSCNDSNDIELDENKLPSINTSSTSLVNIYQVSEKATNVRFDVSSGKKVDFKETKNEHVTAGNKKLKKSEKSRGQSKKDVSLKTKTLTESVETEIQEGDASTVSAKFPGNESPSRRRGRKADQKSKESPKKAKKKSRKGSPEKSTIVTNKEQNEALSDRNASIKEKDDKMPFPRERTSTIQMTAKVSEILEEEEKKALKIQSLTRDKAKPQLQKLREHLVKVSLNDIEKGDMVALRVSQKHYIPGQPCLGKVAALPDTAGLLLVHYYTGSYEGSWRPMMSRSSPYLRRIPASMVVCKFKMTEDGRMTPNTVRRIKESVDGSPEREN